MDLSAGMSPAGSFRYPTIAIQLVEPGVRIRLQHTAEASKMSLRMDAFSVTGSFKPSGLFPPALQK
ncbi:hypothetical protein ECMP0209401_5118 [Escherichia coli MP020940.1]|nr:hypothetical protein ECMP0209401_5118 [Escherichia coli MP020940.1]